MQFIRCVCWNTHTEKKHQMKYTQTKTKKNENITIVPIYKFIHSFRCERASDKRSDYFITEPDDQISHSKNITHTNTYTQTQTRKKRTPQITGAMCILCMPIVHKCWGVGATRACVLDKEYKKGIRPMRQHQHTHTQLVPHTHVRPNHPHTKHKCSIFVLTERKNRL